MDWRKSEHVFGSDADGGRRPARPRPSAHGLAGSDPEAVLGPRKAENGPPRPSHGDRLDEIIAIATMLIARDGYHRASMRQLAEHTGVSLAGLYHYFPSKERLLFLIQFRAFSGLLTEVTAAISGIEDPVEQLRVLIHTHVHYVARNMAALKVCSHELDSLTGDGYEQLRRVRRRYYDLARSIVARVLEEDGCRPPAGGCLEPRRDDNRPLENRKPRADSRQPFDVRVATMSLFGTLNWLYRWYDPGPQGRDRTPANLANQIFSQFLAGIAGGETVRR